MPHRTVSLALVLPLEVAASRRPNPGALTGEGACLLEDGEWVTTGEVWGDGCCLLTVPSEGKDEARDLKHNIQISGIKPHRSNSTFT